MVPKRVVEDRRLVARASRRDDTKPRRNIRYDKIYDDRTKRKNQGKDTIGQELCTMSFFQSANSHFHGRWMRSIQTDGMDFGFLVSA